MGNLGKHKKLDPVPRKILENKIRFTKAAIADLSVPKNKPVAFRQWFYDDKVHGLCVAVAPSGLKTFFLYRWIRGKPEKLKIGRFGEMTVDQARTKAEEMNGAVARGENPVEEVRGMRSIGTLQELFDSWLLLYAKANKRTWKSDQWTFDRYLHSWRLRKCSEITKLDVVQLHRRIGEHRGRYMANRVIELLSAMFNRAIREWGYTGKNPAEHVTAYREKKRSRFLDASELMPFFKALAEEPNQTMRDFFLVALLCGGRRANVEAMQWSEINFKSGTWTIAAENFKTGEETNIAVVPVALRILEVRKQKATREKSESPYVFAGTGRSGHVTEPKAAWKRILARAVVHQRTDWLEAHKGASERDFLREVPHRFDDLRVHDLRRTLGSWQAATGASLAVIGKSLGHQSLEATQIYSRLNLDPVRESVERATTAMLAGGIAGLLPS